MILSNPICHDTQSLFLSLSSIVPTGAVIFFLLCFLQCLEGVEKASVTLSSVSLRCTDIVYFFGLDMCCKPILCSNVTQKGKTCSRLLELQKIGPNAKSCSNVAEHNRDKSNYMTLLLNTDMDANRVYT